MKWILGALSLLLLIGLGWGLWKTSPASRQSADRAASVQQFPEALAQPSQRLALRAKTSSQIGIEFESAPDLHKFVQDLASKGDTGDPEALWMISRAIDYCAAYASNPAAYTKTSELYLSIAKPAIAPRIKEARQRVASRCRGFAENLGDTSFNRAAYTVNHVRAARAGSLAGEASLLLLDAPLSTDREYIKGLVSRVQASKDPEAYFAIAESMGLAASGQEAVFGPTSGTANASYAWQLAACRLGLDCSPSGSTMTLYCAYGASCGNWTSLEEMIFTGLVPQGDRAQINEMVDQILSGDGK